MKRLTWEKKQYDDLTIWMAEVKTVGWQFSIEKIKEKKYEAFIYYGHGEDHPIFPQGVYLTCLAEAQRVCNDWLHNTIVGLNKWI
jgi:Tfp pilus assembly protein PilP